jgi:hypothetical protein
LVGGRGSGENAGGGTVSLATQIERLARLVPGVAGYLDRERARDTDKRVRQRLAAELGTIKRALDPLNRALVDAKDLAPLPALDRLGGKLDKLAATIDYAGHGYHGLFDAVTVGHPQLMRLYAFDLRLFDDVRALAGHARKVAEAVSDRPRLLDAIARMEAAVDRFDAAFAGRQRLLAPIE